MILFLYDGLTTICQGNGFGKSTFAAFIKAMFYGFPRTGARNIVENERKRYDPWQGGKYGGYLEFEIQDTVTALLVILVRRLRKIPFLC